jgi:hypothetical protein
MIAIAVMFSLTSPTSHANIISNGDFSDGFTDWTIFETEKGDVWNPIVSSFDTNGDGSPSDSAEMSTGASRSYGYGIQGGGISQLFTSNAGMHSFSVDTAVFTPFAPGTTFVMPLVGVHNLLVDGILIDYFDFGGQQANTTFKANLSGLVDLSAGVHELQILMTRRDYTSGTYNLRRFLDNVVVDEQVSVPEPGTLAIFVLGLLCLRNKSKRKSRTAH